MTPTSVVYATKASIDKPARELFAVVTVKDRPTTAVAGAESAPIDGGGWQWVAPDGQAISGTDGNASNVVLEGFQGNPTTQPGTFSWGTQAFDITTAQRGGTLIYTDGTGVAHRWKVPAQDAGPQAAQVRKALAG
ncbi:hypothetical protein ABZ419_11630 [Streptomyces cinnamoneus]|uniref:hypothetical protein n=1 Tax=Streptomyces cinnamoneus TaxID=53446 RepID=UPI0033FA1579